MASVPRGCTVPRDDDNREEYHWLHLKGKSLAWIIAGLTEKERGKDSFGPTITVGEPSCRDSGNDGNLQVSDHLQSSSSINSSISNDQRYQPTMTQQMLTPETAYSPPSERQLHSETTTSASSHVDEVPRVASSSLSDLGSDRGSFTYSAADACTGVSEGSKTNSTLFCSCIPEFTEILPTRLMPSATTDDHEYGITSYDPGQMTGD